MVREKIFTTLGSSGQLYRRFSLVELQLATNNFDKASFLGEGGFGPVYEGLIDNGELTVAIKRLNHNFNQGATEFWAEIEILSRYQHKHLISLIGYCFQHDEMILVYEYMNRGALYFHLHPIGEKAPLSWMQRLKICIGTARGLDYLHARTSVAVIHYDVKSTNILLDENCVAKISDFGLSKRVEGNSKGPTNQPVHHRVAGTPGYMDPEFFHTSLVTPKSDVYSFGVVLVEVLSGRRVIGSGIHGERRDLAIWARKCIEERKLDEITDSNLRGQIGSTCLTAFVQIAYQCLNPSNIERPTMATVIVQLEFALKIQESISPSIGEEKIISTGRTYDNQENRTSGTKSTTMKFTRKLRKVFSGTTPAFSGSEQVQQPMSCYGNRAKAPHTQQITRERMGPFLSASGEQIVSMVDAFSRFSIIGINKRIEAAKKRVNEELLKMQTLTDRNGERVGMKMPNLTDRNRERVGMKIIESGQVDRFLRLNTNDKAACVDFLLEELDREAVLLHHCQR